MKIVQINGTYGNADSTGRNTKELHEWLLKSKKESYVFTTCINDNTNSGININFFSSLRDKKIHAFLSRLTGLQGYYSYFSTKKLIKKILNIKPDIIVLGVLHSNCVNFSSLFEALANNNIPVMLILHDCWYFTGHCCYYSEIGCEKWKNNCEKCPLIRQWNTSWFFDRSTKCFKDKKARCDSISKLAVIGVSDWITNEARQSILKDAYIIQTIYNWLDLNIFYPRDTSSICKEFNVSNKKIIFSIASGWSARKGLNDIIYIAKELSDVQFIMAGQISSEIQLPSNVLSIGMIKDITKLAKLYSLADLFLNPSIQETFGKTTAEALACGTPVVVYDTTACKELVNKDRGAVVELKNTTKLLEATKSVLSTGKEVYAENCIEFAKINFNFETNAKKYIECFEKLTRN